MVPPPSRRKFLKRAALAAGLSLWLPAEARSRQHTVRRGDTLTSIARRHGVTISQLRLWNGLTSDLIMVGQKLDLQPAYRHLPLRDLTRPRVSRTKWKHIIAHHSATREGGARSFDDNHRRRGMDNGLAYHFVIGNGTHSRDGLVEVGGRWLRQVKGGHVSSEKYNINSIGICLVGNFERTQPTRKQVASLVELVDYLKNRMLHGRPKFLVHRELEQTLCPGRHFPTAKLHKLFG